MPLSYARSRSDADRVHRRNSPYPGAVCPHVYDEHPFTTGTSRLLGSYWLESPSWHRPKPCCSFAPPPQRRVVSGVRLARAALTVTAYALILTALALTATG